MNSIFGQLPYDIDVVTISRQCFNAVHWTNFFDGSMGRLANVESGITRVQVIFTNKYDGQTIDGGKIDCFVKSALLGGGIAKIDDDDAAVIASFRRPGCADAHRYRAGEDRRRAHESGV